MPLSQDNQIISQNLSWLPTGVWPEVDERREEHIRLVARMRAAYADARTLARSFEADGAAHSGERGLLAALAKRVARGRSPTRGRWPGGAWQSTHSGSNSSGR
jgi:hypothetical protein